MDIEVIHDQMNGSSKWIGGDQIPNHLGKLKGGAIRRGAGEVSSGLGFHDGEDVGGAAALVLVVTFGDVAELGRPWWAAVGE